MKLPAIKMKSVKITSINVTDRTHNGKHIVEIRLKEPIKRIYGSMFETDTTPFPESGEMTKMILDGKKPQKPPKMKRRVAHNVWTIKIHEDNIEQIEYDEKTNIIQWPSYYMLDVSRKGEVWLTKISFKDRTIIRTR